MSDAVKIRELEFKERNLQSKIVELKQAYVSLGNDYDRERWRADRLEAAVRKALANLDAYGVMVAHEDAARMLRAALMEEDENEGSPQ